MIGGLGKFIINALKVYNGDGTMINNQAQNIAEEEAMRLEVENTWGVKLEKLPKNYHIDCAIMQGETVTGLVELRRRHKTSDRYPDSIISVAKLDGLRERAHWTGLPVYLVVKFNDRTRCYRINPEDKFQVGLFTSHKSSVFKGQPGQAEDGKVNEPIYHIPHEKMKDLYEVDPKVDLAKDSWGKRIMQSKLGLQKVMR